MAPLSLYTLYICISYLFLDCCVVLGQVLQNRTVDDSDPAIGYTGQWSNSTTVIPLNSGGTHMYTQDKNAQATFEFTGVAVYFLSPLWPYDVTTQVQLDSRSPEILNLRDFSRPDAGGGWETVGSHVVWSADGLPNVRHMLTMSVGAGEQWAVVDAFIVTWVNGSTTTTPQSVTTTTQGITTIQSLSLLTAAPTVSIAVNKNVTKVITLSLNPSGTPPSPPLSRGNNALTIGLPSVIGLLAMVIVVLVCYYFYRQQLKRRHQPRVNLEEEFPFIPGSPQALSIPPCTPTSTVSSPISREIHLVAQSPEQEHFTLVPLTTQQSQGTLNSSNVTASRRGTRGKPPSYDESMTAHRRARREVVRRSITVVVNPD